MIYYFRIPKGVACAYALHRRQYGFGPAVVLKGKTSIAWGNRGLYFFVKGEVLWNFYWTS